VDSEGRVRRSHGVGAQCVVSSPDTFAELTFSGGDKGSDREGMEGGHGKDPQPGRSLVKVIQEVMGESDKGSNWLHYERSRFENMRKGMP
jgi:hypothetical protein